ncbi:MAG: N-formylglutamate deformylase [Shimia sp.]
MSSVVKIEPGAGPVILAFPHTGTHVPEPIWERLNATGRALADTDWHVGQVYADLLPDATIVRACIHRYAIDANRDPSGGSLYPGQNTTGLVPLTDFEGRDIWEDPPTAEDVEARRVAYHAPYHAALTAEVARVKALHGIAILYDCHSIRGTLPFLFDGRLPDLNVGTDGGRTCASEVEALVARPAPGFTQVRNGRFRGGWTTRHYGRPAEGVHAIQMELAQSTYLESEAPPWTVDPTRIARLRSHLGPMLRDLAALAPTLKGPP